VIIVDLGMQGTSGICCVLTMIGFLANVAATSSQRTA
jgi:hypothetical protein